MTEPDGPDHSVDARRGALLTARRELTRRFAPPALAWSSTGHAFGFQAPMTVPSQAGTYVRIRTDDGTEYLGQVTDTQVIERDGPEINAAGDAGLGIELAGGRVSGASFRLRIRSMEGSGALLGRITAQGVIPPSDTDLFEDAEIGRASAEDVDSYLRGRLGGKVSLDIGAVPTGDGHARSRLLASGFDRHTFLCGQSGSGKTYALGLMLERILLDTDLPLVIIDPNSDFVRLGEARTFEQAARGFGDELTPEEYAALRERYEAATPWTGR